jgi:hypothetical protein
VNAGKLRLRISQLPPANVPVETLYRWLEATVDEIYRPQPSETR